MALRAEADLAAEVTPGTDALLQEVLNLEEVHAPVLSLDGEKPESLTGPSVGHGRWNVLTHEPDVVGRGASLVQDEVL